MRERPYLDAQHSTPPPTIWQPETPISQGPAKPSSTSTLCSCRMAPHRILTSPMTLLKPDSPDSRSLKNVARTTLPTRNLFPRRGRSGMSINLPQALQPGVPLIVTLTLTAYPERVTHLYNSCASRPGVQGVQGVLPTTTFRLARYHTHSHLYPCYAYNLCPSMMFFPRYAWRRTGACW